MSHCLLAACDVAFVQPLPVAVEKAQPVLPDLATVREFQGQPVSW